MTNGKNGFPFHAGAQHGRLLTHGGVSPPTPSTVP
jgi:hypothetical protein